MDSGAKGKKTKPDAEAGRHATVGYRRLTIEEEVAGVPAMSRGKAALQGGGGAGEENILNQLISKRMNREHILYGENIFCIERTHSTKEKRRLTRDVKPER